MTTRNLLIAGNYRQAAQFAYDQGWQLREWAYVMDTDHLRGYRRDGAIVWYVGTWYERSFLHELQRMVATRGFETRIP